MDGIRRGAHRGKILVVEDDPAAARFAAYVLGERGGFDVMHVTDPVVAVEHVAADQWDLMLADLDLPHMSGVDLLASIRRIAPGLPVILTTAREMDATQTHTLLSHADGFLEKPIRPRRLITAAVTLTGNTRGSAPGQPAQRPQDRTP